LTNGRFDASKEFLMKAMDWKRGVGVACLLVTVTSAPARAQTGVMKEPAGIPVVREGVKAMGSPFSPQYQGMWYQSQANRIAMMAWAERYEAEREVYLAEMAAKRAEAAKMKAAGGKDGDVLWTKVHKPWSLRNAKFSDKPVAMPSSSVAMDAKSPIVVVGPTVKSMPKAEPLPAVSAIAADKPAAETVISSKVVSEKVYEMKSDGTMVELKPSQLVGDAPKAIASEPAKTQTTR
jgi:hypothetical protein